MVGKKNSYIFTMLSGIAAAITGFINYDRQDTKLKKGASVFVGSIGAGLSILSSYNMGKQDGKNEILIENIEDKPQVSLVDKKEGESLEKPSWVKKINQNDKEASKTI